MKKSLEKLILEGRCQGYGPDYVPLYKVNELRSKGTATRIYDPFEGREIQLLSSVETKNYLTVRGDPKVKHIREQFLLDENLIQAKKEELGIKDSGRHYSTDLLVDYIDGSQCAYSVKWRSDMLNPNSERYKYRPGAYVTLVDRMGLEISYWNSFGTEVRIVTDDSLNRTFATNIWTLLHVWEETPDPTIDVKTMYLVAHGCIRVDLHSQYLAPKKIRESVTCDINTLYDDCIHNEERRNTWLWS